MNLKLNDQIYAVSDIHTFSKIRSCPNSSGLKTVFEKLRFRDGLDLTVEVKLRFKISPT